MWKVVVVVGLFSLTNAVSVGQSTENEVNDTGEAISTSPNEETGRDCNIFINSWLIIRSNER